MVAVEPGWGIMLTWKGLWGADGDDKNVLYLMVALGLWKPIALYTKKGQIFFFISNFTLMKSNKQQQQKLKKNNLFLVGHSVS